MTGRLPARDGVHYALAHGRVAIETRFDSSPTTLRGVDASQVTAEKERRAVAPQFNHDTRAAIRKEMQISPEMQSPRTGSERSASTRLPALTCSTLEAPLGTDGCGSFDSFIVGRTPRKASTPAQCSQTLGFCGASELPSAPDKRVADAPFNGTLHRHVPGSRTEPAAE